MSSCWRWKLHVRCTIKCTIGGLEVQDPCSHNCTQ
jgi:hypothetical protein